MVQSLPYDTATAGLADAAEKVAETRTTLRTAGDQLAEKAADVGLSAKDALAEMRRIADAFAATTGQKAGEALDVVKTAGDQTADRIGALVDDARAVGRDGLKGLADAVAERPVAAVAVAAGIGLLLGLVSRGGGRP